MGIVLLDFSYILSEYLKIIINTVCYLQYLPELPQQPDKKQKMVMKTYKELLGICIKSKKAYIYKYSMHQISWQRFAELFCHIWLFSMSRSACRWHVFPDMYSSLILPHKCPRTKLNLTTT